MKIKSVSIENFRSIGSHEIALKDFTIIIGENGTGKTSLLEAINYSLSLSFLSGRIKYKYLNKCAYGLLHK